MSKQSSPTSQVDHNEDGEQFETSLAELEEVVRLLEAGELNLDEALAQFARGVALTRACNERLRAVEVEMERLLEGAVDQNLLANERAHDETVASS